MEFDNISDFRIKGKSAMRPVSATRLYGGESERSQRENGIDFDFPVSIFLMLFLFRISYNPNPLQEALEEKNAGKSRDLYRREHGHTEMLYASDG